MESADKEALLYTIGTPEFADLGIMSLNRPQVHNAFNDDMLTRMCEVFEAAAKDNNVRALLLKSEGKSFCAGADLTWMQKTIQYTEKENLKDGQGLALAFRLLNAFPKPVVIQVQGPAFGGGVGLMACGDYVISLKKAFFSLSEVKLGLIPAVISPFVISKMGESAARALFITGKRFMAEEAFHYGLIHEIVETPEELESATQKVLKAIWEGGPMAQQEAKSLIFDVTAQLTNAPLSKNDQLHAHTAQTIARVRVGAEAQEGMQALLEKKLRPSKVNQKNKGFYMGKTLPHGPATKSASQLGPVIEELTEILALIISETNGITLQDTLELCQHSLLAKENPKAHKLITEFRSLLGSFHQDEVDIETLLGHPVAHALFSFFKAFPLHYQEEHIHLTGSLTAEFIYPRLMALLQGKNKKVLEKKITDTYGKEALPIQSVDDVAKLIQLSEDEAFDRYLEILLLPKLILVDRKAHKEAAYHMAHELYHHYNVGRIRLKFSFNRVSSKEADLVPGLENLTSEEVVLGLYEGFSEFQKEHPLFDFILSPSFRKEPHFFDAETYKTKKDHFLAQVEEIFYLLEKYPFLRPKMVDVDTVGDERQLYRKEQFQEMRLGFRKLQFKGLQIRSHHGETWPTLKKGVQAVDNAMNIWHIDTLEHGLSLGLNPNYYYHMLFEKVMELNQQEKGLAKNSTEYQEITDMEWKHTSIRDKLIAGEKLNREEILKFIKTKFHTSREVEHYQHDVLNRMINKKVSLIALPSSNNKLTGHIPRYKDHPFSWWEKKGVELGVGTDNYVTLKTNFIREMLILLLTDAENLKITKLLMIVTGEKRRPYLSQLLWQMREVYPTDPK